MFRSPALALIISLCSCALLADEPAPARSGSDYFPLGTALTWKYLVTVKHGAVSDKPVIQTLAGGTAVKVNGRFAFPIGDELYSMADDAIYLVARTAAKIEPLPEPQKILPLAIKTGDWWKATTAPKTVYNCLGARPLKTDAGDWETQCLYIASSDDDGRSSRQTYRYYARGVGLVREITTEETAGPDGALVKVERKRDLVAFTDESAPRAPVVAPAQPIRSEHVRGMVLDPGGLPVAQAILTLQRTDQPQTVPLHTDLAGRFAQANLDPAGTYVLQVQISGYRTQTLDLHSADGSAVQVHVRLEKLPPATGPAPAPAPGSSPGASALPLDCVTPLLLSAASQPADEVAALIAQGKSLAWLGQHAEAIAKYEAALRLRPDESQAHGYMAASLIALGKLDEAQDRLNAALKLQPDTFWFHELSGQIQLLRGNIADGKALYDKAAVLSPRDAGGVYADLAAALAARHDRKLDAMIEAALKAAIAADPPSLDALFNLGQSYAAAGKQDGRPYLKRYLDETAKLPEAQQDKRKIQLAKQMIRALDAIRGM